LDYIESNDRIINERSIGKNVERSIRGLFEIIYFNSLGRTEENQGNLSE
jgi:hypothetical protein